MPLGSGSHIYISSLSTSRPLFLISSTCLVTLSDFVIVLNICAVVLSVFVDGLHPCSCFKYLYSYFERHYVSVLLVKHM